MKAVLIVLIALTAAHATFVAVPSPLIPISMEAPGGHPGAVTIPEAAKPKCDKNFEFSEVFKRCLPTPGTDGYTPQSESNSAALRTAPLMGRRMPIRRMMLACPEGFQLTPQNRCIAFAPPPEPAPAPGQLMGGENEPESESENESESAAAEMERDEAQPFRPHFRRFGRFGRFGRFRRARGGITIPIVALILPQHIKACAANATNAEGGAAMPMAPAAPTATPPAGKFTTPSAPGATGSAPAAAKLQRRGAWIAPIAKERSERVSGGVA